MKTHLASIPKWIATQTLVQSDRTCCVCRKAGRPVQIHHIDKNRENHAFQNLAVLCMDCHTDTQIRGGFHRKLDADQVVLYRDEWLARVASRGATDGAQRDSSWTYYNGSKFRTRIAAKWAVFFDCLGMPYQYEPENYEFGTRRYVPDFFLPCMDFDPDHDRYKGIFLEVKGPCPTDDEIEVANTFKDLTGRDIYVFYGSTFEDGLFCWGSKGRVVSRKSVSPAWIEQCPFCGEIAFSFKPQEPGDRLYLSVHPYCLEECKVAEKHDVMHWFLDCQSHPSVGDHVYRSCHSPMLDLAYDAAKSARFEDANNLAQLRGIAMASRGLREQRIFSSHETLAALVKVAQCLRSDPSCPRYRDQEPWYVPHLLHLRSGSGAACPCSSCEHDRKKMVPQPQTK